MKARKVYEFKRTRKRGLSKQTELHSDIFFKKQIIEEWFKQWLPNVKYQINDDLSVEIFQDIDLESNKDFNEIPFDNIKINGFLDLSETSIKKLPDNLTIINDLYLYNTPIEDLPNNLNIGGSLDIVNTNITDFPNDLYVKYDIIVSNDKYDLFKHSNFYDHIVSINDFK